MICPVQKLQPPPYSNGMVVGMVVPYYDENNNKFWDLRPVH